MTQEKFLEIIEYIRDIIKDTKFDGHVYVVGGAVRDLEMGLEVKDIDLAVDLPNGGISFVDWLSEKNYTLYGTIIFHTYGTGKCVFKKYPDIDIECVQTRKEQYKDKNSRNPDTVFGTIEEDAFRRDLTINALYYNISSGEIIDPTGKGKLDIENKTIKVTNPDPDIVYIDDPLRILRTIRFSTRYGWNIEDETFQSMKRNVDRLSIITKERIRDEFEKILMSGYAVSGLTMLKHIGAMKYIIPELEDTYDMTQNSYHFGTVWQHTLAVVEHYHKKFEPDVVCLLACLLHDIGKIVTKSVGSDGRIHFYEHEFQTDLVEKILRNIKYDNETIKEVCFIVRNHMRTKNFGNDCQKIKQKNLNKLIYSCQNIERFDKLCRVIDCDNMSHHPDHVITGQYGYFVEHLDSPMFGYKLPITGNDVMETLGIEPGQDVKMILDKLVKQAFQNPEITKEQCIKQLPHILKQINNEKKVKK